MRRRAVVLLLLGIGCASAPRAVTPPVAIPYLSGAITAEELRRDVYAFADDSMERNEIAAIAKQRGELLLGEKLRGDQVLVIGDTPFDITCARYIGARVLAVGTGMYRPKDLLPLQPDWAVDNLEQLSARHVCL